MPLLDLIVVIIASIGNVFLGLFTYFKNYKSATNKLFFLFTLSIAGYIIFNYLALHQDNDELTLFWIRMIISIAVVINLLFFLLVVTFPKTKLQLNPKVFLATIVFTFFMIPVIQSPLIFKAVNPFTTQPVPGMAFPLFLLQTIVFLGGGFVDLLKKLKKAIGVEKNQLKFFLLGTIFMFVSILITNLFLVIVFKTTNFVGLLPIYTLVFLSCISYAIVKHRFLDINLLVARAVAYTVVILMIGGFYSFAIFVVGSLIFGFELSWAQFIINGAITILVAFTFQPLRRSIESITDKIFYKGYYNAQDLLKSLSTVMSTTIELDFLTTKVLQKVLAEIRIEKGTFVVLAKRGGKSDYLQFRGNNNDPLLEWEKIDRLLLTQKPLVFDELEESDVKTIMRDHGISLVLPLVVRNEKIGLLILGSKASGDIYSSDDLKVLEILASEISVAIQNALAFEEIKLFTLTLQDRVNKATKELRDANEKLQQLDKLKDEFVSLASHELRTPMTAIKSYLWMTLEEKGGPITEKQKFYLERAYVSNNRLIKLVNDMLNVSRIESGRMTLDITHVNLLKLAEEIAGELTPRSNEVGVKIIVSHLDNAFSEALCDPDKIREVFYNLIGNSLKFTPSGGTITISFHKNGSMIETYVKDTGRGIAYEDMKKLFQKFQIVGNEYLRKQNTQGTGLGLYISKSLIEMQGGKMWVESDGENKGSTFSFSLKVFDEKEARKIEESQKGKEPIGVIHAGFSPSSLPSPVQGEGTVPSPI